MFFCGRCRHGYTREVLLEQHKVECQGIGNKAIRAEMLEKRKNILTFQNHQNQLEVPISSMQSLKRLWTRSKDPHAIPPKATHKRQLITRHVDSLTSPLGMIDKPNHPSSIEDSTLQNTSWNAYTTRRGQDIFEKDHLQT